MRFPLSTVVALGALQTFGVYAQDCVNQCVDGAKPSVHSCPDPNDAACVCVSQDFVKGVAECARAPGCEAADEAITGFLSGGFCVGQTVPPLPAASEGAATTSGAAATSEAPGAAETSSAADATSAPADATSAPADATSAPAEATSAPDAATSSAVPPVTSEAPEATATESAEPSDAEESASATDADSSSTASGAAGAGATSDSSSEKGDDDSDKDEESSDSGMSKSAQAGVGVGVTLGVLALLGIAGFFWKKRQNQQNLPRGNVAAMSPPMSSGDRGYPSPDQGSIGEKHGYDLEMMSNRYEDMLPREEPRHMV